MQNKTEVLNFWLGTMTRAVANGGAAFDVMMQRNPEFLAKHVASFDIVVAVWPDPSSDTGFMFMPIKRVATCEGELLRTDAFPCETREQAFALLNKFGDATLQREFADFGNPTVSSKAN